MHIVIPYAKVVNFMGIPPEFRDALMLGEAYSEPLSYVGKHIRQYGVQAVRYIEEVARTCYRAEGGMTEDSYEHFLDTHFIGSGHTNMSRFSLIVVEFMVDRGVAQEILRHLATLVGLHESQRYCNYSKDKFDNSVGFIKPRDLTDEQEGWWLTSMEEAELNYFKGLKLGLKPQIAADALPRASAGKVTLAGCFQAWRHFTLVRSTKQCHPKLLNVTVEDNGESLSKATMDIQVSLLKQFKALFPIFFDDIEPMGDYITNIKKVR